MADLEAHYRIVIQKEYDVRASKNKGYSKNAFAKFLGLTPSYLSKLLQGKILMSLEIADQAAKKLGLEASARRKFLFSVAEEQRCHALYLIDPHLTDCDPAENEANQRPLSRRRKRS